MRLLGVELNRFRSRRAVVLVLLTATLLTALLAGTALWDTRPVSAKERARAEAQAQVAADDPQLKEDLADCRENPTDFFGPRTTAAECDNFLVPRVEDYLSRGELDLSRVVDVRGVALVVILTALLIIVGATFAGSDWQTGSMGNQLLFEPRRGRVWAMKALAVLLGGIVAAGLLIGGFWVTLTLVADARGLAPSDDVLRDIRWTALRGTVLVGGAALGGYALTMLLRRTIATVAVLFAYAAAGEALVVSLPIQRASDWSLANNVLAWVRDGTRVFDDDIRCAPSLDVCDQSYQLGLGQGAAYLGVLLLATLAVSVLAFRRRDVP
jgi:ABC-2 type transport system permease protein